MASIFKRLKNLYLRYRDEKTVFIYQMGKVGSTSLENTIENAVHLHNFYWQNHPCPIRQNGLAGFGLRAVFKRLEQRLEYFLMRLAFKRRSQTKIVTLIRSPLERNISMFFHDLDAYLFDAYTNCQRTAIPPKPTRFQSSSLLEEVFNERFDHEYPLQWFDEELKRITGIDVYDYPYKNEPQVIEKGRVSIFLCDIKDIDASEGLISRFVDQNVTLARSNLAELKWYAEQYKQFKREYNPPQSIRLLLEESKYFHHFYKK